jgi:hypothetical protein
MGMSFELGGSTLEVAIGLAFAFFLLSVIVSALTELIAWATKRRANTLEKGVVGLLGETFADKVLSHPLTKNDLGSTKEGAKPSYISSRNFSLALIDELKKHGGDDGTSFDRVAAGVDRIKAEAERVEEESPLAEQLGTLLSASRWAEDAKQDIESFRQSTEKWFDDTMDRVSGWYKRWSQVINIVAALAVAIVLNASAVRIAERLAGDETVRSAVVAGAQNAAGGGAGAPKASGQAAQEAVDELKSLQVPLLWGEDNNPFHDPGFGKIVTALVGWLLTAAAISLGAPFWFDALSKLAHLRTTGKRPEPAT